MPEDKKPELKARHVGAVVLGNALEFYDFLTYAFFAVHIGNNFFPSATPAVRLLETLATFGAGFLTRPLGGLVIGRMGDRIGRKPTMLISFGLMGLSIAGLALTPPASRIGVAAPIAVLGFRLLQGFALGGEVGPTTAFLVEAAPLRIRGFVVSLQSASQNVAILAASLIGLVLTRVLTAHQLDAFGWRIAVMVGALVVPVGLWLRSSLPETLHSAEPPPKEALPVSRLIIFGGLMLLSLTVQTYVQTYLTTYAITSLHLAEGLAFGASVLGAIFGLLVGPLMAAYTDRVHRRHPLLVVGAVMRLLTTLPIFWIMIHYPGAVSLLAGASLLSIFGAMSPNAVAVVEALPQRIRSGAFGLVYAIVISVFGGTTQFVIQGLIDISKSPLAPAWYLSGALLLGLVAAVAFPETAPAAE